MPARRLLVMAAVLLVACAAYLSWGARGDWAFILSFRGTKLAALIVTGTAIAVSTKLFQTISGNRILTPSIMGFDALFVLLETTLLFALGGFGYTMLDPAIRFAVTLVLMTLAAILLFGTLMHGARRDLHRMILVGIIFGVLFRSLSSLLARMIDPNEYAVLQANLFASFNQIELDLLGISTVLIVVALFAAWRLRDTLDAMELGREIAINLGIDYDRHVLVVLGIIAVLVSVATALVGPVVFFGLLITSLAYQIMPGFRHRDHLIANGLLAGIVLVAGQTLMERVFHLHTPLSVIIEMLGGLAFLILILRGHTR